MFKERLLERPQYCTRFCIQYRCQYIIFSSKANVPRPQSVDSNEDRVMDFDNQRDYMDQDVPVGQVPTADPGPPHHFLSGIPDWMNINQEGLNLALESLPIPLKGPIPPGISLQEAIYT